MKTTEEIYKAVGDNGKQFCFAGTRRPSLAEAGVFLAKKMDENDVGRFVSIEKTDNAGRLDTDEVFGAGDSFSIKDAVTMHMKAAADIEETIITRDVLKAMSEGKDRSAIQIYEFLSSFAYAVRVGIIPRYEMASAGSAFDGIMQEAETVSISVTGKLVRIVFFDKDRHIVKLVIFSANRTLCGQYSLAIPDMDDKTTVSIVRAFFQEYEKIKKGLADDAVSALITQVDRMDKKADDAGKEMFDFLIKAGSRNGLTK